MSRFFFSMLVVTLATCACASNSQPVKLLQDVTLPITLCLDIDTVTAAAAKRGETRLQLNIRNRAISHNYSSALTLSLLKADGNRSVIHTFGMQPDRSEEGRALAQHFQIALHDVALTPNTLNQVCFELAEELTTPVSDEKTNKDVSLYWRSYTGNTK